MEIEAVEVKSQPILFISRTCAMDPPKIAEAMGSAFHALGEFIGKNGIEPAGPPIAIYREWDEQNITFDVGLPVGAGALEQESGEVKAGETPSGRALKSVHKGPYAKLPESYAEFEGYVKDSGMPQPTLTWEIYLNDSDTVPEAELLTELYMALPD